MVLASLRLLDTMRVVTEAEIHRLLAELGITRNYKGHKMLSCAIEIAVHDPDCMQLVSKCLYPEVAKRLGIKWQDVERNIRTIIDILWVRNPNYLADFTGLVIPDKPTVSELIAILAYHLQRDDKQEACNA